MTRRDPDERCPSCGVRLSRVDADHEDRCIREAQRPKPKPITPLAAKLLAVGLGWERER